MVIKLKPILKWAGGKTKLAHEILDHFYNVEFKRYIEPFFGSGAIYFSLIQDNPKIIKKSLINDSNKDLIRLYKNIKKSPTKIISEHEKIKNQFNKNGYYYIRDKFNGLNGRKKYTGFTRSAALMVLNKTCFNGLYRVNKNNMFNVPEGSYKKPSFVQDNLIHTISKVLPDPKNITYKSYRDIRYQKGDLVYFDPPYDPINKTSSFTDYSGKFGKDKQKELCDKFDKLDKKGVNVILSNSKTPFIKKLYSDHKLHTVYCSRNINSKEDQRGKIQEYIIVGKNFGN